MSNLHVLLDEANKHDPKGFIPAANNTFPWKDELGLSTYREQMELPKAINFVDGAIAPPTFADGDIYIPITGGVLDAGWGAGTLSNDWVKFTNTIAYVITPLAGYLCYDVAGASWMEYDGSVWAAFGAGGTDTNLGNTNLTLTDPARTYDVLTNELQFKSGSNNRIRITANGVGIGHVATPAAGTSLLVAGTGATSATTTAVFENSLGLKSLELKDDLSVALGGNTTVDGSATLTTSSGVSNSLLIKNGATNQVQLFHFTGFGGYMRLLNAGGSVGWEMTGGGSTPNYMNTANRFGFGTSAPNALVNINSTTTGGTAIGLTVTNTGVTKANLFYLNGFGGYMILKNDSGGNGFELAAQGTPGYINTGQPFGIGTSSPQAGTRCHVGGNFRFDGTMSVNGVAGFTGTGAYTNFTITNGIITSAS